MQTEARTATTTRERTPRIAVVRANGGGWLATVSGLPDQIGPEWQRVNDTDRLARQLVRDLYEHDALAITDSSSADDHTVLVWFER